MKNIDLIEVEKHISNIEVKYNDIDCSYILRNDVVNLIRSNSQKGNKKINISSKLLKRFFKSSVLTFSSLFKKSDVWVFSNSERRKLINGLYIDRVCSFLTKEFRMNALYIENSVHSEHKKPCDDKILSESILYLLSYFYTKFFFKKDLIKIKGDLSNIEETYGIKLDLSNSIKKFVSQYKVMSFLLKVKRKPKSVFMVYPDGYLGYIKSFKENNIKIIELQHGVIYENHPSYNYSANVSIRNLRPDVILTYGNMDANTLVNLKYLDINDIHVVGNYTLWLYKNKDIDPSIYLKDKIKNLTGNKNIAMVATVNDLDILYDIAKSVTNLIKDFTFYIIPRLKLDKKYDDTENIFVLDSYNTNVYELITLCDIHITISSTTALEALYLGKKSIVYELISNQSFYRSNYPHVQSLIYVDSISTLIDELHNRILNRECDSIYTLFNEDFLKGFDSFCSLNNVKIHE